MQFVSKGCTRVCSSAAVGRDSCSLRFLCPKKPMVLLFPGSPLASHQVEQGSVIMLT